jgi:hypothetical protein
MNNDQLVVQPPRMRSYLCARCARRCLVVGEDLEQRRSQCICGGDLMSALLAAGQYELIGQDQERTAPRDNETE